MKAAILVESKKPLVVADIALPERLECGQVLVRIHRSGICGAQIGEIDAVKGPDKFLPHLLGHEGGGVVEEIGPGVRHVKPGDHVVLHWRKGPGIDSAAPKYRWGDRTVNAGWVTTFQERAVVSENRVTAIAPDIEFEVAALMGCAVTTAMGVLTNDAALKPGESLAVCGVGGVGLNVVQGAALMAAWPIIAIDRVEAKLAMAARFGATHTINSEKQNVLEEIRRIAGPEGADVIVETTGLPRIIEEAYEATSPRGRTILVGVPKGKEKITIYSLPLHFEKVLKGTEGGRTQPARDIPRYLNLYRRGKLQLKELITHHFPLERINDALDLIRAGGAGRVIIDM
ncbi:MAG TPA: zinc-binding dehydrogenase [bacterium]